MRTAALTLAFLVALVARADLAPPTPPRIPEGIAEARGQLGLFRGRDAGIVAVDLSTGEIRWTSPPFGRLCQPPFAILGDRMLCVREGEGEPIDGGMSFARELVSIRTRTGERSWSVPLSPRLLPAPVPGGAR